MSDDELGWDEWSPIARGVAWCALWFVVLLLALFTALTLKVLVWAMS